MDYPVHMRMARYGVEMTPDDMPPPYSFICLHQVPLHRQDERAECQPNRVRHHELLFRSLVVCRVADRLNDSECQAVRRQNPHVCHKAR